NLQRALVASPPEILESRRRLRCLHSQKILDRVSVRRIKRVAMPARRRRSGGNHAAQFPLADLARKRPLPAVPTNFPSRTATSPRRVTTLGRPLISHPSKAL